MSIDIWMPLYVGDYLADTAHLNAEQHGMCLLLMMVCWRRGGLLPDDEAQLAAIARVSPETWARHRDVVLPTFVRTDTGWTHTRIAAEIARAQAVSERRRAGGRKGAELRWLAGRSPHDGVAPESGPMGGPIGDPLGEPLAHAWQTDGQSQPHSQSQSHSQPESETPPGDLIPIPTPTPDTPQGDRVHVPDPTQPVTEADLQAIWTAAPQRSRERSSLAALARAVEAAAATGAAPARIAAAVRRYARSDDATRNAGQYAMSLHRLIETARWQSFTPPDPRQALAHWTDEHWALAVQDWRDGGGWPEAFGPEPGEAGCLAPAGVVMRAEVGA